MSRCLYLAGFGNSQASADEVGESIRNYGNYDDFDAFNLGYAFANADIIRKVARGADVYTHSAGMLAIVGALPDELHSFNAPLPVGRLKLVAITLDRMLREPKRPSSGLKHPDSPDREFLASPIRSAWPMVSGSISAFHGINVAVEAKKQGIHTGMAYTFDDAYFKPTEADFSYARNGGVMMAEIPGLHGELVSHTERALYNYFAVRSATG